MATAVLIGSTGLVGCRILELLCTNPSIANIHTISRRAPSSTSTKVFSTVSKDTSSWSSSLSSLSPKADIYVSALGASRRDAGSFDAQRLIDYDLNLSLLKSALESRIKTCVLISSAGSSSSSRVPYHKMKGELEDKVKDLGFENCIILRPGLIIGGRDERNFGQWVAGNVATALGGLGEKWAQDGETISRAAVRCGMMARAGKAPTKVWVLDQADVVKYGKLESEK